MKLQCSYCAELQSECKCTEEAKEERMAEFVKSFCTPEKVEPIKYKARLKKDRFKKLGKKY